MADDRVQMINVALDKDLHYRLKIGAAVMGVSMTRLVAAILDLSLPDVSSDRTTIQFVSAKDVALLEEYLAETGDKG